MTDTDHRIQSDVTDIATASQEFLADYQQTLEQDIAQITLPGIIRQQYDFVSCLKHQNNKQVYLVSHRQTGDEAILRVMQDEGQGTTKLQRDQEYAILSQLDFFGIPKVYGSWVEGRQSFLLREYFSGRPLDAVLSKGRLDIKSIVAFSIQLCAILGYLHNQTPPVIHRDIKPGNIIVMPDGRLGLTDFGIARTYKEHSDSDTSYEGTLLYAPPEQFGFSQSTPLSDIYALGIVMLCMATGSPMRQGIDERVRDRRLRAIIKRCVAFDPKDRFQSVQELAERLGRIQHFQQASQKIGRLTGLGSLFGRLTGSGSLFGRLVEFGQQTRLTNLSQRAKLAFAATMLSLLLITDIGLFALVANPDLQVSLGLVPASNQAGPPSSSGNWGTNTNPQLLNPNVLGSSANPYEAQGYQLGDLLNSTDNIGNLTGNITNGGYAVESKDAIYLAFDDGVYRMNRQTESIDLVVKINKPRSLNYHHGLLYVASDDGIFCLDPSTFTVLWHSESLAEQLFIMDNRLFYTNMLDKLRLYEINLSNGYTQAIISQTTGFYRNLTGGFQYLTLEGNGSQILQSLVDKTGLPAMYAITGIEEAAWLCAYGSHLYFYDSSLESVLAGTSVDGAGYNVLAKGSCSHIVACNYGVFYISPATGELAVYRFSDGNVQTVIRQGVASYCLAGDWVFYKTKDNTNELRMVHLDGSDDQLVRL
ncbi:MAG: protein kinase [Coriobacteriales bacterium]|jgi:serine/threonine protein kinase|nr:protein kinase [Coriobacteriales bacterium]